MLGRVLGGRYRIVEELGEGGMASIFRAIDDESDRAVAVKVVHEQHEGDREFAWRFRREAKTVAALQSPHTVRVFDHGVDGPHAYMVMELVDGTDLLDELDREGRLPEARAAGIMIQVCAALEEAHGLTIVHRDLKPDNVMLVRGAGDRVKVLDFGIAKILDVTKVEQARAEHGHSEVDLSAYSQISSRVGTPQYMSPEQGCGEPVDARTDVYGSGVLLYELITGQPPFDGDRALVVLLAHVNQQPPLPSSFVEIHPRLERVILRALAKRPAERQQSAKQLADDLSRLLPELATTLRPAAAPDDDETDDDEDETIQFRRV